MKISKLIELFESLYYSIRRTVREATYNIRSRCQRFKRGYSYGDVWDMDWWFINTVKPMLTHLRDYGMFYPGIFKDRDEWKLVLSEMINCLDFMDEDYAYSFLGFCEIKDILTMTPEDFEHVDKLMEENKDRFFELFSKYFYHLWD